MYYYLNGEITYVEAGFVVVDCSGVGYKLTVSQTTAASLSAKIGKVSKLYTHLAVREDGIELFGFATNEEKECFNRLISVSGVGPKAAMSILSTMTADRLALSICTEDTKAIAKAPGIGAKTAARIVLELKDKISKDMLSGDTSLKNLNTPPTVTVSGNLSEASEALMVLGYDKPLIQKVLSGIDPATDVGEIIRLALKKLSS